MKARLHPWRIGGFRGTHSPGRPHGRPGEPDAFGAQRNGAFFVAGATRNATRTRRSPGNRVLRLVRRPTQRRVFCRRCDTKRDTDPAELGGSNSPPGPEPNATARFLSQVRHETRHGPGGALGMECSAWPGDQRNGAFFVAGATRNATQTRRSPGNRVLRLGRHPTQRRVFCRRCDTNATRTRRSLGDRILHLARSPTQRRVFCRRCDTKPSWRGRPVRAPRDFIDGARCTVSACLSTSVHVPSAAKFNAAKCASPGRACPPDDAPARQQVAAKQPPNWILRPHAIQDAVHSHAPQAWIGAGAPVQHKGGPGLHGGMSGCALHTGPPPQKEAARQVGERAVLPRTPLTCRLCGPIKPALRLILFPLPAFLPSPDQEF